MRPRNNASRGYSIMEILVVVAIIGILSLVTVPAFMNFQRSNSDQGGDAVVHVGHPQLPSARHQPQLAGAPRARLRERLPVLREAVRRNVGGLERLQRNGAGNEPETARQGITFSANTLGDIDSNSKKDLVFRAGRNGGHRHAATRPARSRWSAAGKTCPRINS